MLNTRATPLHTRLAYHLGMLTGSACIGPDDNAELQQAPRQNRELIREALELELRAAQSVAIVLSDAEKEIDAAMGKLEVAAAAYFLEVAEVIADAKAGKLRPEPSTLREKSEAACTAAMHVRSLRQSACSPG